MQMIKSHDFAFSDKKLKSNEKILHTSVKEYAVTNWLTLFGKISRFCKRRGTLFKSLLCWLAVEVLSPCQK